MIRVAAVRWSPDRSRMKERVGGHVIQLPLVAARVAIRPQRCPVFPCPADSTNRGPQVTGAEAGGL